MSTIYQAIWLPIALVLGVGGADLSTVRQPVPLLLGTVAAWALLVVAAHLLHPARSWSRVPPEITRSAVAVFAVWSYLGLTQLFGALGGLVILSALAVSPPVLAWIGRAFRRTWHRTTPEADFPSREACESDVTQRLAPEAPAAIDFRQFSDEGLCRAWRTSFVEMQQTQLLHAVAA